MSPELIVRRIETELSRHAFSFHAETGLHDGVAKVLDATGLAYRREVQRTKRDRFDFLVEGSVVIEIKAAGTFPEAGLQAARYAEHEDVLAVIIATSRPWSECGRSVKQHGKTISCVRLMRKAF